MSHSSQISLTSGQRDLLRFFIAEGESMGPQTWVEFFPSEARSVHALARKGFVRLISDGEFALASKGFSYLFANAPKLVSGPLPIYHLTKGALAFLAESIEQTVEAPEDDYALGVCKQLRALCQRVNELTVRESSPGAKPVTGRRYGLALELIQEMTDMIAKVDLPDQQGMEICRELIELDAKLRERQGLIEKHEESDRHRPVAAGSRLRAG